MKPRMDEDGRGPARAHENEECEWQHNPSQDCCCNVDDAEKHPGEGLWIELSHTIRI